MSHFRIHFLFVAFAAGVCLILPRRIGWLVALAIVVASLAGIGGWARLHISPGHDGPPPRGDIRVMSFNTWARNRDLEAMQGVIARNRPDIVGLVEYLPPKHEQLPARLKSLLPHAADCVDKPHCYMGLLSRWPIVESRGRSLWEGPPYLYAKLRAPGGDIHVFVVHTLRFPWARAQLKQIHAMARLIARYREKGPVIIMGDFNATPFSRIIRDFEKATELKRLSWLPTWPSWFFGLPQLAIDHVFISRHFRKVRGPLLGESAGSDHFPVLLELRAVR